MTDEYAKNIIKDYNYWTVYIHENQGYLGRCIVWCKREDALDLTEATAEEREELFIVLSKLRRALTKAFNPDWFNYSFLGNGTRHLHGHFIPRYAKPLTFMNVKFEDKNYGHNYKSDHSFLTPPEVLKAIQQKIKENI